MGHLWVIERYFWVTVLFNGLCQLGKYPMTFIMTPNDPLIMTLNDS